MTDIYKSAEKHNLHKDEAYTYDMLVSDILHLKERYPDIPVFSIGKSVCDRDILCLKLGTGSRKVFLCGAHHGMEWLTAKVCVEFAGEYLKDVEAGQICGMSHAMGGSGDVSLYIVPMVNPDGAEIAALGYKWQANARGVDLNHNYDALWAISRSTEKKLGITAPCASKFGGAYPESEPESRAVADFTRQNHFDAVFALHSQGMVIYYDFCGVIPDGTLDYLDRFERVSDYVRDSPAGTAVYGGFKDWFIKKYQRPGFTVEIGLGENPLPLSQFDEVYAGVRGILWEIAGRAMRQSG